jgi:hypothetical protein
MAFFLSRICDGKVMEAAWAGDSNSHGSPWANILVNFLTYKDLYCYFSMKQPA